MTTRNPYDGDRHEDRARADWDALTLAEKAEETWAELPDLIVYLEAGPRLEIVVALRVISNWLDHHPAAERWREKHAEDAKEQDTE